MLLRILDRVIVRWKEENLVLAPVPSWATLEKSFADLGVRLTDSIREVFHVLPGFDDNDMDSECLTFWNLKRITRENSTASRDSGLVKFADFLIDSHTYGFVIDPSGGTSVYCCYDKDYIVKISDSFETFFEYYLTDPKRLFPN